MNEDVIARMLHNLSDMHPFWERVRQVVVDIMRDAQWESDDPAERLMRVLRGRPVWATRALRRQPFRVRLFEENIVSVHPERDARARIVVERNPNPHHPNPRRALQIQTDGNQFRVRNRLLYDRMRLTTEIKRAFIRHLLDGTAEPTEPPSSESHARP